MYSVTIELGSISHIFVADHRLRLSIAGADWPLVWPAPRPFSLTLYHDAEHPTQLILPVIPSRRPELPRPVFDPPEVPAPPAWFEGQPGAYAVQHDMTDGTTRLETSSAFRTHLEERNLIMSESNRKILSFQEGQPLSCQAVMTRHLGLERQGWKVGVDSSLKLRCTQTMFVVEIELAAQHDGELVFERKWQEEFPRLLG